MEMPGSLRRLEMIFDGIIKPHSLGFHCADFL
jgi:hypothetical protein